MEEIFLSNLKPVVEAKKIINKYISSLCSMGIEHKEGGYIDIYSPEEKITKKLKIDNLQFLEQTLKLCYSDFGNDNFRDNYFSKKWLIEIENEIIKCLSTNNDLTDFIELVKILKRKSFSVHEISKEITQIFTQTLKTIFSQPGSMTENFYIESSNFYYEFGRILSDFYSFGIDNFAEFLVDIDDLLEEPQKSVLKAYNFSKTTKIKMINFFNRRYGTELDFKYAKIIEHLFCKSFNSSLTTLKNRLNIQYLEFSSVILNCLLPKYFFRKVLVINEKTYNFYYPNSFSNELIFDFNSELPSISKETYKYHLPKDTNVKEFFSQKYFLGNNMFHQKSNLNSTIKHEAFEALKEKKKNNSFVINKEFLLILCQILEQKSDIKLISEIYDIDFENLMNKNKEKKLIKDILSWCLDFESMNIKFKINEKNENGIFYKNLVNKIYSYKTMIYYAIQQSCIMGCFPRFYYDWFFDSRARFYTSNSALSLQGSKISRLLVKFENSDSFLSVENLELMLKTLKTMMLFEIDLTRNITLADCKKLPLKKGELFNFFFLFQDVKKKKSSGLSYALDASSSGLQMLSIFLENMNLGEKCGLLESKDNNIYEKMSEIFFQKFSKLDKSNDIYKYTLNLPLLKKLLETKKLYKIIIMTLPYGSTYYGRLQQLKEVYTDFCIKNGVFYTNADFKNLNIVIKFLDVIVNEWCKKNIPECFSFRDFLKKTIFDTKFKNDFFYTQFVKFNYKMTLKVSTRRKIGIKSEVSKQKSKISVFIYKDFENLSNIEKKKLKNKINNSFIANLVHSLDAHIALNLVIKFNKMNVPFYTVHDCYRIDYKHANILRQEIYNAYIDSFHFFLEKNETYKCNIDKISNNLDSIALKKRFNYNFFVKE